MLSMPRPATHTRKGRKRAMKQRREVVQGTLQNYVGIGVGSHLEIIVRKGVEDEWLDHFNHYRKIDFSKRMSRTPGKTVSGYVADLTPDTGMGQPTHIRIAHDLDEKGKPDLSKGYVDIDYGVMHSARFHNSCIPYIKLF
jgi:hypothetical protein